MVVLIARGAFKIEGPRPGVESEKLWGQGWGAAGRTLVTPGCILPEALNLALSTSDRADRLSGGAPSSAAVRPGEKVPGHGRNQTRSPGELPPCLCTRMRFWGGWARGGEGRALARNVLPPTRSYATACVNKLEIFFRDKAARLESSQRKPRPQSPD